MAPVIKGVSLKRDQSPQRGSKTLIKNPTAENVNFLVVNSHAECRFPTPESTEENNVPEIKIT